MTIGNMILEKIAYTSQSGGGGGKIKLFGGRRFLRT